MDVPVVSVSHLDSDESLAMLEDRLIGNSGLNLRESIFFRKALPRDRTGICAFHYTSIRKKNTRTKLVG